MLAKFAKPPGCADCTLSDRGSGFAPPSGPQNSPLVFLGEALGYNEAMQGEPFIGAAGGLFNARILPRTGLTRPNVKVHNCVNCQPPGDWLSGAPWEHSALTHCRQYLQPTLDNPHLKVLVTLGDTALRQALNLVGVDGIKVKDFHGTVHRDPSDRFWVVPTFHPSHLQRGAINLLDVVRFDIEVAKGILGRGGYDRRPVSLVLDPPVTQFAAWVASLIERLQHDPTGIWITVDIETPDKQGRDENELSTEDRSTQIQRVNICASTEEGWTVPYDGPYIALIDQLCSSGAVLGMWNKWYDESRLRFNSHKFLLADGRPAEIWDLMWAAHHYQSDWPLSLGFWAPFCSDFGAWKHLAKQHGQEAYYGCADGLQTRRVMDYLVTKLMEFGMWEAFYRHTHLREQYVLRPAHESGMPISESRLDEFHDKLQGFATERLEQINQSHLAGTYKPKEGYPKPPKATPCPECAGQPLLSGEQCLYCLGFGEVIVPPASVLGKAGEKGDTAKQEYINQGVELVEREVDVQVRWCESCQAVGVGPKHNCLRVKKPKVRKKAQEGDPELPTEVPVLEPAADNPVPVLSLTTRRETRWFWKLPFNPDAHQQILKFIKDSGETPGRAKKTRKETANKETLRKLAKKTGDPVYTHLLEYKAVKKVDSTYAIGAKKRIWSDGRLHPFPTFRPSMFRDSYVNPNVQNVIADKEGKQSLAAGFRHCIVADPGYRLVELDYSGIEGVDTGWLCGDPDYLRLATLGVHAYLTAHLLHEEGQLGVPPSLSWSDEDLSAFFSEIKKKYPALYDKAKRCVHGNNYGLTVFGMVENFPDVFPGGLKEAEKVQDMYYALAPKLPAYHTRMRDFAYEHEYLGGPWVDDYTLLTLGGNHPFSYRHWFYGVMSFRPLSESDYRKLQWIAKQRGQRMHPRVVIINGRPFEKVMGEDSKRVIAFPPQSIAAGQLKEAELALFHPDSPDYMGQIADGRTPLIAPIHDSLLLHVPDRMTDWVVIHAAEVMRRPFWQMPMPVEWNRGTHLRVNVAAKVSPVGGSWADVEDMKLPDMAPATARESLYLPVEEAEYEDVQDLEVRMVM